MIDDLSAGGICAVVAICASYLFHMTDRDRPGTRSEPWSVRVGYLVICVAFILRAVDFFTIAQTSANRGHVNAFGLLGSAALLFYFANKARIVYLSRLPDDRWARRSETEAAMHAHPDAVPAVIPKAKAGTVLRALGARVAGPGEPPESLND